MKSRTRIVARVDERGVSRLVELTATAPVAARPVGDAVYLVASAAGPLGGDDVEIDIEVGPGATLVVVTNAASVALAASEPSRTTVRAEVGAGGRFAWLPEPLVVTARANHEQRARVCIDAGAVLHWREEIVFGRTDEHAGRLLSELAIDRAGRPVLRQAIDTARPGIDAPGVTDDHRAMGKLVWSRPTGGPAFPFIGFGADAAWFDLDTYVAVVSALGPVPEVRAVLDAALAYMRRATESEAPATAPSSAGVAAV